jgi:OmpR family response regulator NblR
MNPVDIQVSPSVLVVQSDPVLAAQICEDLQAAGYQAIRAQDANTAWQKANDHKPHLIVIDTMLGSESGLKLCSKFRSHGIYVPVLMLLGRDEVSDRIACLESGADDYFLKPYRREDFLKLMYLYLKPEPHALDRLQFGDFTLDISTRTVLRNHQEVIALTMKEFELLKYFMEHPREVLNRDQILANVWGYDFMGESNVIEVYIRYLRLKLETNGNKRLIHTVRGIGYVLRDR